MTAASKITGVRTIGVPGSDQDRALDFYVGTLGFEKRLDTDLGGGRRWIEVAPLGEATTVALVRAHDDLPAGVETGIRFVAADAEAVHADLRASGVAVDEVLPLAGCSPDVRVPRRRRQRHGDRRAALAGRAQRSPSLGVRVPLRLSGPVCATRPRSPYGACVPPAPSSGACVPQAPNDRDLYVGRVGHEPHLAGPVCNEPHSPAGLEWGIAPCGGSYVGEDAVEGAGDAGQVEGGG